MGDRKDTDQWENVESAPHRAILDTNLVTTMPTGEPAPSMENERQNLIETIGDLENTLKFMGKLHPQRENLDKRLNTLKAMLKQAPHFIHWQFFKPGQLQLRIFLQ